MPVAVAAEAKRQDGGGRNLGKGQGGAVPRGPEVVVICGGDGGVVVVLVVVVFTGAR